MSNSKRILDEVRQRRGLATPENASQSVRLPPRKKRHWWRRFFLVFVLLLLTAGGIFGYKILAAGNKITVTEKSILGQLKDLLLSGGSILKGEEQDRINILLIAVGGEGHRGENLADTIMLASIRPKTGESAILSIPRDLYVQVPDEQYFTKINAVHAYGESKKKDSGPLLLKKEVETITGQPIHYFARIDFTAFKQIVDAVGGIDITIEQSFFDYWHKISFPAGTEHMNGERALAYVRARYIEGPEGGDFKRAARQQQVLFALREQVFSPSTAFDFTALNTILNSLADNVRTDLELWEMKRSYELARTIDHAKTKSVVLSTGPQGVLVGSTEILGDTPASILKPRTGDYSEIHRLALNIFDTPGAQSQAVAAASSPLPSPSTQPTPITSTVEIRNGTTITGLAARIQEKLTGQDFTIKTIGNATIRSASETTVYIVDKRHAITAEKLANLLNAGSQEKLPADEKEPQADIVIILGSDAQTFVQ